MIKKICIIVFAAMAITTVSASADEPGKWSASARAWYFLDDFGTGEIRNPSELQANPVEGTRGAEITDPYELIMLGGAISYRTDGLWSLSANILFGENDNGENNGVGLTAPLLANGPSPTITWGRSEVEYHRLDVELNASRPLNDYLSLVTGGRIERVRADFIGCNVFVGQSAFAGLNLTFDQLNNACPTALSNYRNRVAPIDGNKFQTGITFVENGVTQPLLANVDPINDDGFDLYSVRLGFIGTLPVTEDERHSVLLSGILALGYRDAQLPEQQQIRFEDAWVGGPDLAVGYLYAPAANWSFDARYRAQFTFQDTRYKDFDSPELTHGLAVSLNRRF
jgi:hypothetical protein